MWLRNITIVSGFGVIVLAPGYFRADEIASTTFQTPTIVRPSACTPAYGNPLAELCKQVSHVGSDAFNAALFK